MYQATFNATFLFAKETGQKLYITPALFVRMFKTFKLLLNERRKKVEEIQARYYSGLAKISSSLN